MIVNNSLTNTLLQTAVPDELRGRIMGFYSFVFVGMAPFGAFFVGLAAEHVGAPLAVGTGGLVCVLAVALAAWRGARLGQRAACCLALLYFHPPRLTPPPTSLAPPPTPHPSAC